MNWFFWRSPQPNLLKRFASEPIKITLVEWQQNEQLVTAAEKISKAPIWRAMMAVMYNECPAFNLGFKVEGTIMEERAALQLLTQGYMMAINNLNAMAAVQIPEKEAVATFEPEEQEM